MVIVTGHLIVEPDARPDYLADCAPMVEQARGTSGCLDFCLSADLLDPSRINILERWEAQSALDAFRGDGPSSDQQSVIRDAQVAEYDVVMIRSLS